jgi:hypothetical protein
MSDAHAEAPYDRDAIFDQDGPLDPLFMADAIQSLMRALPLNNAESANARRRHMRAALIALAATNPRDPIEVMLAVQAISAFQAACACWRIGMNGRPPAGESTRHISAAATAARTFDSMLRAIERRQAKPLAVPVGRPAQQTWTTDRITQTLGSIADRIVSNDDAPPTGEPVVSPSAVWSPEDLAFADEQLQTQLTEAENEGLDLANTEGILPGGGMILPEDPTPQQAAYIGRRLRLMYQREYAENLRKGIKLIPKIRPIRPGDLIP